MRYVFLSFAPRSRSSSPRSSSTSIASASRATSSAVTSRVSSYGESRAWCRISFAQARPIPAITRWSRSIECSRRDASAQISASRSAPMPSASGPTCASSCSASSGVSSQTPARFFAPASVSTSCEPPANTSRNAGVFGPASPYCRYFRRPAVIRCTRITSAPSSVGKSKRFARRWAPARRRPSSADTPPSRVAQALSLRRIDAIRVSVRRGNVVEAVHRVHAVAVHDGAVIAEAGDPSLTVYMRSSSKPLQALPVARARDDLDARDLAIASASHLADDDQLAAVRALLAKAPATVEELECGAEGEPPSPLNHNCAGKHAGMLALCRAQKWTSEGYRLADHPVQQAMLAVHSEAAEVREDELAAGVDGCGVVTFALPLERMAYAFARFDQLDGGDRVAAAMRAYPEL